MWREAQPVTAAATIVLALGPAQFARAGDLAVEIGGVTNAEGGLTAFGYLFTEFFPREARTTWLAILAVGLVANFLIVRAQVRARRPAARDWRLMYAMLVLVGYGFVCHALLGPLAGRETAALWPSLFMFGFVLAGLWLGRFFLVCGLVATGLILIGYFALGAWFYLWMAAVQGVTLILGGLWLRRIGTAP